MTPQIKQRIEQIRRGEVPEGYKKTKVGIVPEEWEEKTVGKCIIEYDEKTTIENQYPVLTSARSGLMLQSEYYSNNQVTTSDNVGYNVLPRGYITYRSRSDDGKFKFNENTIIDKGIISYFYPVFSFNSNVSHAFMLSLLNHSIYRQSYSFVEGTAQQVLSLKKLQSLRYCVPPLAEQEKIAAILQTQDKVVELQQKKIDELKKLKKVYLSKMFPKKGCNVPEIRFPGFTDPWEQRKFGDLIKETREKTTVENEDTLLSCAIDGMFLNSELFSHFRGSSNIGYLKVKKNDLILSAQNLHLGNCNVNLRFEHGIISPAYKVYELVNCNSLFMQAWVKQDKTKDFFLKASTEGASVCRKNIVWEELYKQELPVPKMDEQMKIGQYFDNLNNLITLHQRKLEEEQKKKKALMQLLLTGIVRVEVKQ